uniref:NADH-ubiquinone oxidoreductase chain 4 n=1 Tax=Pleurostomum flabellatum TaxID=405751 RepID=A0A7T0M413_9EUKA|nr:NADH dehydrogenase subunit 4 [Pleurostomum flabellatum]QPL15597.1 NADH dehydrogenase subunit 4 [Pleurostomum flabellatum]
MMIQNLRLRRYFFLDLTCILFFFLNILWGLIDFYDPHFQFSFIVQLYGLFFSFGIDGFSLYFSYLTGILSCISIMYMFFNYRTENDDYYFFYSGMIFFTFLLLLLAFFSLDLILFYVCFELVIVPFFFLVGISSLKKRRVHAIFMFFFYTLFGSFFMFVSIFQIYSTFDTTNFELLLNSFYDDFRKHILWFFIILSFSVKIPIFPFHLWLLEAHVESPTEGSVLLAGVLLKLGSYGIIRFLVSIFPFLSYYYSPLILLIGSISVFYSSFSTMRQIDMKRVIAYSSVAHMNVSIIGLFLFNHYSVVGSMFLMIAHGVVSSGMFFIAGMLYTRFHTKIIQYYGGAVYINPILSSIFFFFIVANIGFPLLSNFVGESMILIGLINCSSNGVIFFCLGGIFICAVYSLWMLNRIIFLFPKFRYFVFSFDITFVELAVCLTLIFFVLWMGIVPYNWILFLEYCTCYYYFDSLDFFNEIDFVTIYNSNII